MKGLDNKVKSILISQVSTFENHCANNGEGMLGNATEIKKTPDGRAYVSGQMFRHAYFEGARRFHTGDATISTSETNPCDITNDLRSDLGGYMKPVKAENGKSHKRMSPIAVTFMVAKEPSKFSDDFLTCFKEDQKNNIVNKEISQKDDMLSNILIDIQMVGMTRSQNVEDGRYIKELMVSHISEEERRYRINLFVDSAKHINDFSNQSRNAINGEPNKCIIVLDGVHSTKAMNFFNLSDIEKKNVLEELDYRGAKYFIGDDTTDQPVWKAYASAKLELSNSEFDIRIDKTMSHEDFLSYGTKKITPKPVKSVDTIDA